MNCWMKYRFGLVENRSRITHCSISFFVIIILLLGSSASTRGEEQSTLPSCSLQSPCRTTTASPIPQAEVEFKVDQVNVTGISEGLQDEISKIIQNKPGQVTNPSKIQQDVKAIFDTGYFQNIQDIQADWSEKTTTGVKLKFALKPYSVLKSIRFIRSDKFNPRVLPSQQMIDEVFHNQYGKTLNGNQLIEGFKKVTAKVLQSNDVALILKEWKISTDGVVTVEFIPETEFQVGEVIVEGVTGNLRDEVYKVMKVKTGKKTTYSRIQQDLETIQAMGIFEDNVNGDWNEKIPTGVRLKIRTKPYNDLKSIKLIASKELTESKILLQQKEVDEIFRNQYGKTLNRNQLNEGFKQATAKMFQKNDVALTWKEWKISPDGIVTVEFIPETEFQVGEIIIEGVAGALRDEVFKAMKVKAGKKTSSARVAKDLNAINDTGFFYYANSADWSEITQRGDQRLKIKVQPYPVIESIQACKYTKYTNKKKSSFDDCKPVNSPIIRDFRIKRGEIYNSQILNQDLNKASLSGYTIIAIPKPGKSPGKIKVLYYLWERSEVERAEDSAFQLAWQNTPETLRQAIAKYQLAEKLLRAKKDLAGEVRMLNKVGDVYLTLSDSKKAANSYYHARSLSSRFLNPSMRALTLSNIAHLYRQLGENEKAIDYYREALPLWKISREQFEQYDEIEKGKYSYSNLGLYFSTEIGRVAKSEHPLAGEAMTLFNLAETYRLLGNYQQTLELLIQAQEQWLIAKNNLQRKIKGTKVDDFNFIDTNFLFLIRDTYTDLNQGQKASEYEKKGLNKLRKSLQVLGTESSLAESVFSLFFANFDDQSQIVHWVDNYFSLWRSARNQISPGDVCMLNILSEQYGTLGNYQLAKARSEQALSEWQALSDNPEEIDKLNQVNFQKLSNIKNLSNVSNSYRNTLPTQSISNQSQASSFEQFPTNGQQPSLNTAKLSGSNSLPNVEPWQVIPSPFNQKKSLEALDLVKQKQAETLNQLSKALSGLGEQQQALDKLRAALTLWTDIKSSNPDGEVDTLNLIGLNHAALGKHQAALTAFNQAQRLAQSSGHSAKLAEALYSKAQILKEDDRLTESLQHIRLALDSVESSQQTPPSKDLICPLSSFWINNLSSPQARAVSIPKSASQATNKSSDFQSYIDRTADSVSKQDYYQFYLDLLMQLHRQQPSAGYDRKALEASERSHARGLRQILSQASIKQTNQEKSGLITNQAGINKPLTVEEIQQQILDNDMLLLEYSLGDERSYLWVVSKTGFTAYELPKRSEIEETAKIFYDYLTVPSLRVRPRKTTQAGLSLSRKLLPESVIQQLGNKRLLIVGDGLLQYIPFSALPISTQSNALSSENLLASVEPLLGKHEIVSLPSASTLAAARRNHRPTPAKTLAILADPVFGAMDNRLSQSRVKKASDEQLYPRLEGTRQQADQIVKALPVNARAQTLRKFGFDAKLQPNLSQELGQYRIVHIATHGILDSKKPERSGMILSSFNEQGEPQRSLLSPSFVFNNLRLAADLVVLSGCRTGLGTGVKGEVKGEGLIGLTGSFLYAGTKSVVASLWSIDDAATKELMTQFYQAMFRKDNPLPPAAALRFAQQSVREDPRWQAPYYWAGFIIQGEWR
jgi:CHAT domain-containing protein/outer membrane protein assembly factor BamA